MSSEGAMCPGKQTSLSRVWGLQGTKGPEMAETALAEMVEPVTHLCFSNRKPTCTYNIPAAPSKNPATGPPGHISGKSKAG